jgi:hypothetical protein
MPLIISCRPVCRSTRLDQRPRVWSREATTAATEGSRMSSRAEAPVGCVTSAPIIMKGTAPGPPSTGRFLEAGGSRNVKPSQWKGASRSSKRKRGYFSC